MHYRWTKAGKAFGGAMVLLYLAALTSQSGLLLLLAGILLGCLVVNVWVARRGLQALELEAPKAVHVSEGQRLWQPWRLTNHGLRPVALLEIESPAGLLFRLGHLGAQQEVTAVPDLTYCRRGVYAHDRVRVSSGQPFGLLVAARPLRLPGEVVVHPAVYETAPPRAAGYDVVVGGKHKGQRRASSGVYFAGVRPFQAGDPLRQVHWRSSAKGLGLMVKTYEEELSGRVAFVLECGARGGAETLDNCVRATASLIFAALEAGHHVEWIDLAHLEPNLVPPFSDGHEVLEALARVQADPEGLTEERLLRAVDRLSRKSAVHLMLTGLAPAVGAVVEALRAEGRVVCVYLPPAEAAEADLDVPVCRYSARSVVEAA